MSAAASFAGGVLDIQLATGGLDSVGLFASGNDFFVDTNNNQSQDVGEVSGLVTNIGRLQATSPDLVGSFVWRGDFSRAGLNQPNGNGAVVHIEGFQQTQLLANFQAQGNLHVHGFDQVTLGNQATVQGSATIVSDIGSISSDDSARWSFLSSAEFSARGPIQLAQSPNQKFVFQAAAEFTSTNDDVLLGNDTNLTLDRLSIAADNATVQMHGDVALHDLRLSGDLFLSTDGNVSDSSLADLRIAGNLDLAAGSITLGNDAQDVLSVQGISRFDATHNLLLANDVSIGAIGQADLTIFSAQGRDIILHDTNGVSIASLNADGDLDLSAGGTLRDEGAAIVEVRGNAHLIANAILLADNASDHYRIDGSVELQALAADMSVGLSGDVTIGELTATGRDVLVHTSSPLLLHRIIATGSLDLASSGAISDVAGSFISAATSATLSGSSILLADNLRDSVDLHGSVQLNATGDVTAGLGGAATFGTLSVTGRDVRVHEQDDVVLGTLDVANDLQISTAGNITDITGASLSIGGSATFNGINIALSTNANDSMSVGGLLSLIASRSDVLLGPAGNVLVHSITAAGRNISLSVDSSVALQDISAVGNLLVQSQANVTTLPSSLIDVAGTAAFSGSSLRLATSSSDRLLVQGTVDFEAASGDMTIGSDGLVQLGAVSAKGSNFFLQEDAELVLYRVDLSGDAVLSTRQDILDSPAAHVAIAGNATLNAASIRLADDVNDTLNINGNVSLIADAGDVLIGPAGVVSLGALSARGDRIEITEFSDMLIASIDAAQHATLTSIGNITDTTGARIQVTGDATFDGHSIILANDSQDSLQVTGSAHFIARHGDVTIGPAGDVRLGDVRAEGVNLSVNTDNDLLLRSINATGNLALGSSGAIIDLPGTSIDVGGNADLVGNSITLADNLNDRLNVLGHVSFVATIGDVSVGPAGQVTLGIVSANGRDISIAEDAAISLDQLTASNDLVLSSPDSITDVTGASLRVDGDAQLFATSIFLADQANDQLNVAGRVQLTATGDVTVGPAGLVTLGAIAASGRNLVLYEDAATEIESLQATRGLILSSSGAVTDRTNSLIRVDGTADISGTSLLLADQSGDRLFVGGSFTMRALAGDIVIGAAGQVDVGIITAQGTNIQLHEDADSDLMLIDASQSFTLTSAGRVQDEVGAIIKVRGNATVTGTSITLADNAADQLAIEGINRWRAVGGDVNIGPAGQVQLGDIIAAATNVFISEDSDMSLVDVESTNALQLNSSGAMTDRPGAAIRAGGPAQLLATSIVLSDQAGDRLAIAGDFVARASSGDIVIGPAGLVTLGQLDLVGSNVFISEDADSVVRNLEARANAQLESSGDINDAPGAAINVQGTGTFIAQAILLADSRGDIFNVVGNARFIAADDVVIGEAGLVTLGDISASARNLILTEDADTSLSSVNLRETLRLTSSGGVSDVAGAPIDVRGDVRIVAQSLLLADHASDRLQLSGTVDLQVVGDLVIADPGQVMLGTINANATNLAIFEDTSMVLNNVVAAQVLRLDSGQSIINLIAADSARGLGVQASTAIVTAGSFVHLGNVDFQRIAGEFHANGLLGSASHFGLNAAADATGVATLDSFNQASNSAEPVLTTWIDGSQLADVQQQFSYKTSFADAYGFYLSNQSTLEVGQLRGVGDGLHLYLETLGKHDLNVSGTVQIANTSTTDGAMALVAGAQLAITGNGSLETVAVTGLDRDNQRVLVPSFQADAFDGGKGPTGFESTRSVILVRAFEADTKNDPALAGAQNVFQQVSSQFGASGEAGFLAIVRYADGRTQLFDTYQEVVGSFDGANGSKGPAGTFQGAIPAHATSDGAAALFARSAPFTDSFLNGVQELPTSVLYRRSTDFFLFENGGTTDAAVQTIDLNSDSDQVLGVLTNAIPPSFSLPNIIATTTPLLPTPILRLAENNSVAIDIDQELETKVEFDATRQVIIYRVGYDDKNQNGQPEDVEMPDRDQIVERVRSSQSKAFDEQKPVSGQSSNEADDGKLSSSEKLAPGQLDLRSRDVQKDLNPTPETLDAWIEKYRHDPRIGAGAYTIVEQASRTGVEVLRIFSVRDFDEPTQSPTSGLRETDQSPRDSSGSSDEPSSPSPQELPAPKHTDSQTRASSATTDDLSHWNDSSGDPESAPTTHALFLAGGLVWLNKRSARVASEEQLRAVADLRVSFDRAARGQRSRAQQAKQPRTLGDS